MEYQIKDYPLDKSFHETYYQVLHFLNRKNEDYAFIHFHWSRWEWMFARDNLKTEELSQIKLFLNDKEELVGLLSYEDEPGVWFAVYDEDQTLKTEIATYFVNQFKDAQIIISDDDEMRNILYTLGYQQRDDWFDPVTRFKLRDFEIPETEGYLIKSLDEDYRLDQIHYALYRGFDHGDDIEYSEKTLKEREYMTSSPNYNLRYAFVAHHEGHYVAFASVWYLKGSKTALVEPVATVPEHRRKGLARACIYKAIQEVFKDGAHDVFVGSERKVYQDMGFEPFKRAYCFKKQ